MPFFLYSCDDKGEADKVLAQVYQTQLTAKELNYKIPKKLSRSDSTRWVEQFINQWVKEQVLLHEADKVLSDQQKNKEEQLREYKKQLLLYEFEKNISLSYKDTVITSEEVVNYYQNNRKEFELRKNISRLHYIKLQKNSPGLDKVKLWFGMNDSVSIKKLESYCALYAENYFFNDKVWLTFDDILKEIPLKAYNEEEFLRKNKFVTLEDANYLYLVNIVDFRIKNDVSPIEFEIENIKNILSNKKKTDAIKKKELSILRNAEANGAIKINK